MSDETPTVELDGAIIQRVVLVDQVTRPDKGSFHSVSLPGHLIHMVTRGQVAQQCGDVVQQFGAGQAVWYHENEDITGKILEAPWEFYTVNFFAPPLTPPPLRERVQTIGDDTVGRMKALLDTWRDASMPSTKRHIRIHALLLEILFDVVPDVTASHRIDSPTRLWWELEAQVKRRLGDAIDLGDLEKLSGRNRLTINRACQRAVGMSPMKRIKLLRLSYAQGLVLHSQLPMTTIALSVGYGRVQEFSRDYHRHFAITPTDDRKAGPRYQTRERP